MGFADLTLLLIGEDALAQQLCVHLEHRGADLERAAVAEALDTIRVAVPDLVILSADAAKTDADRIRDGLVKKTGQKPPRLLVLCERAFAARLGTHLHAHLGSLDSSLGAELIASCIESLCALMASKGDGDKTPLRTLIANVQKSHVPAQIKAPAAERAIKKTLQMPMAIAVPPPAAAAAPPAIVAPPPAAVKVEPSPPTAPTPIAKLLEPVHAPDPVATEVEMFDFDVSPTAPPEPMRASEDNLTPTHVEIAMPQRAEAPVARSRRPRQLALIGAAAIACLAILGIALSGDDEGAQAPAAVAAAASLHTVSRAEPKPAPPAATPPSSPPAIAAPAVVAAPEPPRSAEAQDEESIAAPDEDEAGGVDPARARANQLVNVGHRLRKQSRWGMAEASYLKALRELPTYARAISGLVQVHLGRRDGTEAVRWAKKLVALQPKPGTHHRLLGDAYALAGDKNAARKAWQYASRLGDRAARERLKKK